MLLEPGVPHHGVSRLRDVTDEGDAAVLVRVRVAPGAEADLAADALWAEGATAVEVRDDAEGSTLLAGYPTAEAGRAVAARLGPALGAAVETVDGTDWQDAWRQWVHPVPVGGGLLVVPAWRPVPLGSRRLALEIDPGACFGSGTHASSRLVLAWLDRHPPVRLDVADVGTGSGILAVAAARLGALHVRAVDIDPAAVPVTRANAERNGVGPTIDVSTDPVETLPEECADLVLVNVTAGVHAQIGAHCCRLLRPGGWLVLAGLLPGQWQHVTSVYARLETVEHIRMDGWEGAWLQARSPD